MLCKMAAVWYNEVVTCKHWSVTDLALYTLAIHTTGIRERMHSMRTVSWKYPTV